MMISKKLVCGAVLLLAGLPLLGAGERPKKHLALSWEFELKSPSNILEHAERFAAVGIDGVGVHLYGRTAAGHPIATIHIVRENWPDNAFAEHLPALSKMAQADGLRESLISSFRAPRERIAWTNDVAWGRIARNMSILARLARQAGIKGLFVDDEDYNHINQFKRQAGDPPIDELAALVRQRGREIFGSVFREYPDITIFFMWLLSVPRDYYYGTNVQAAYRERRGSYLWGSFIDGLFDVLPPGAKLIDGNENSYRYRAAKGEFHKASVLQRTVLPLLLSPENRPKYRMQVSISESIYVDMHVPGRMSKNWNVEKTDGSYLKTFQEDLRQAVESADEYVWTWAEKAYWIEWKPGAPLHSMMMKKTWDQLFPGMTDSVRAIVNPAGFAEDFLAKTSENLLPEGRCLARPDCVAASVPDVHPGEFYAVRFDTPEKRASAAVSFKRTDGKWFAPAYVVGMVEENGALKGSHLVQIPPDCNRMTLSTSATNNHCQVVRVQFGE